MQQERIMQLLEEAATASRARCTEIASALLEATANRSGSINTISVNDKRLGIAGLVLTCFNNTADSKPTHLPHLFPIFAMACGDREGNEPLFSPNIRWNLVKD